MQYLVSLETEFCSLSFLGWTAHSVVLIPFSFASVTSKACMSHGNRTDFEPTAPTGNRSNIEFPCQERDMMSQMCVQSSLVVCISEKIAKIILDTHDRNICHIFHNMLWILSLRACALQSRISWSLKGCYLCMLCCQDFTRKERLWVMSSSTFIRWVDREWRQRMKTESEADTTSFVFKNTLQIELGYCTTTLTVVLHNSISSSLLFLQSHQHRLQQAFRCQKQKQEQRQVSWLAISSV